MARLSSKRPFLEEETPGEPNPRGVSADAQRQSRRHRRPVSSACQPCKKRKTKCDGEPAPCEACLQRHTLCVFTADTDQRRKLAKAHKAEEAEYYRHFSHSLIEAIASSTEAEVRELTSGIRRDASMRDITELIEGALAKIRRKGPAGSRTEEQLEEMRAEARSMQHLTSESRSRRKVMGIHDLIMPKPLFNVRAAPWTSGTDDDDLASELVSLYFTWWNPCWRVIEPGPFVDAMAARDTTSPFCSPFLANAILSSGSHWSDNPAVADRPLSRRTRGERFYEEARRLWRLEEEDGPIPSLANLQGLSIMISESSLRGKDKVGWALLGQAIHMCHDLDLDAGAPSRRKIETVQNERLARASKVAVWGLFIISSTMSLSLLKPPRLEYPQIDRLPNDDIEQDPIWKAYPQETPYDLSYSTLLNANIDLCKIFCQATKLLFSKDDTSRQGCTADWTESADILINDLQAWRDTLPQNLRLRPHLPAPAIEMNLSYYCAVLSILELLRKPEARSPPSLPTEVDETKQRQDQSISYLKELIPFFRTYRETFGLARISPYVFQTAVQATFILMRSWNDQGLREAFLEVVTFAIAGGKLSLQWKGIVCMIRPTSKEIGAALPSEVDAKLLDFERDLWRSGDYKLINSSYPSFSLAKEARQGAFDDDFTMGELLDRWSELQLQDHGESST